jgi:hypothetical protein
MLDYACLYADLAFMSGLLFFYINYCHSIVIIDGHDNTCHHDLVG